MKTVAEALKQARRATGISQYELAAGLGCTQGFVAQLERGIRPIPVVMVERLPEDIRGRVIDARIAELKAEADKLEQMR